METEVTATRPEDQSFIQIALRRLGLTRTREVVDRVDKARMQGYLEAVEDMRSPEDEPVSGSVSRQGYRHTIGGEIRGPGDLAYDSILSIVWQIYLRHPVAKRLAEVKRDHILGRGIKIVAENDPELQRILDSFVRTNRFTRLLRKFVHQLYLFGEQCLPIFIRETDGRVRIGYIDPSEIESVVQDPDNALIKAAVILKEREAEGTAPWLSREDKRRVYRIVRPYEPVDGENGDREDMLLSHTQAKKQDWEIALLSHHELTEYTGDVVYWSVNDVANQTRGLSDLHQLVPHLAYHEDVLMTLADRENTAALFAWNLTLEGADELRCQKKAKELALHPPERGDILVHNEKETWEFMSTGMEQAGSIQVEQALLDTVCAGAGIPRSWLGEGGGENRATAREQNRPTWKTLQHEQDELRDDILQLLCLVRDQAEIAGEWLAPPQQEPDDLLGTVPLGDLGELSDMLYDMENGTETGPVPIDDAPITPPVEPGTIALEMAEVSTLDVQAMAVALERLVVALASAIERGLLTERRAAMVWAKALREIGVEYDAETEFLAAMAEKKRRERAEQSLLNEPYLDGEEMDDENGDEPGEPQYRSDRERPDEEPEPQELGGTKQAYKARGDESVIVYGMTSPSAIDHQPEQISAICPFCGFDEAYTFHDHGTAALCGRCGSTFDYMREAADDQTAVTSLAE